MCAVIRFSRGAYGSNLKSADDPRKSARGRTAFHLLPISSLLLEREPPRSAAPPRAVAAANELSASSDWSSARSACVGGDACGTAEAVWNSDSGAKSVEGGLFEEPGQQPPPSSRVLPYQTPALFPASVGVYFEEDFCGGGSVRLNSGPQPAEKAYEASASRAVTSFSFPL